MEITNDIRTKMFAEYFGQEWNDGDLEEPKTFPVNAETFSCFAQYSKGMESAKLILKPLSAITTEDAIEACGVIGGISHLSREAKIAQLLLLFSSPNFFVNQTNISGYKWLQCAQFLQSKGYDLPQYLLGGKTLQEVGLAIYENINS